MVMIEPLPADVLDETVFVHAPSRQDSGAVAGLIERGGLRAQVLSNLADLPSRLDRGAGAILLSEESIASHPHQQFLLDALEKQPNWSEIPVLLIGASHGRRSASVAQLSVGGYANVVLLERPLRFAGLVSALKAALRARRKQYQIRDYLAERDRHELELEQRVRERTRDLEQAHESQEHAERAMREAQKAEAIGQLTGGVAHDFNNLLMVFTGGLTLLEKKWNDREQRDFILKGMRQAAERGQALTKQLLAFARRIKLDPQPVDFAALLEGMRVLMGGALRGDIEFKVDIPSDLWPLFADRTQLELAILNLAVNARDAMPQGGALRISAENRAVDSDDGSGKNEYVAIAIEDTGAGIPPALLERVFDPFFTTKPIGKGTGLGLSQVYGFARQSGGTATIESEEGRGTKITLLLPRSMEAVPTNVVTADVASLPLAERDKLVLLVEDNDDVAGIGQRMLETLGFRVERASNAKEALKRLYERTYDVLFTDVVMPGGMNGLELAREASVLSPKMPVILASGYSDALRDADGNGFPLLEKPYQLAQLEQALKRALQPVAG
jgi:signal transduction histidine kinase